MFSLYSCEVFRILRFPNQVNQPMSNKKERSKSEHLVGCIWARRVIDLLIWISEFELWFCFSFPFPFWSAWTRVCLIEPCENNQPTLISLMFIQQICVECLPCARHYCKLLECIQKQETQIPCPRGASILVVWTVGRIIINNKYNKLYYIYCIGYWKVISK